MTDAPVATLVFWASVLALAYTYAGYPLLLLVLGRGRRTDLPSSGALPRVSVIVAAYNEAECIAAKVRNTLAQDYPAHLLECLVVSDGSTDGTEREAASTGDRRVRVLTQRPRQGKCLALNQAVPHATGEVLVFTDANTMLERGALRRLVEPFRDPEVGLVSGRGVLLEHRDGSVHAVTNAYLEFEQFLRAREQAFGYIVWADGALYALRQAIYQELRPEHANDFLHPIQTVLAGYRAMLEPRAVFTEPASGTSSGEFRRQARMISQGFYIVATEAPRLFAAGHLGVLWQLMSHRLLRWIGAGFLVAALGANVVLASTGSPCYVAALALHLTFYGVAAVAGAAEALGWKMGKLTLPYYFCVVNAAGVVGLVRALSGNVTAVWKPVRSGEMRS
jgi:cellulose synthase/poly-beta-1,6-N-acetylglucosamine synthase-like glycosyltransferase